MAFGIHKILQKHYSDDFFRESGLKQPQYRFHSLLEDMVRSGTIVWIKQFKDDTVFLDIGSNIGIYSLAAYMVGVSAIYSVDPLPHNIFNYILQYTETIFQIFFLYVQWHQLII